MCGHLEEKGGKTNSLNFGRENGKPVFGSGRKVYVAILVDCLVVVSNPAV